MSIFTYHTRIETSTEEDNILSECANKLSTVERMLFSDLQKDDSQSYVELKKYYIVKYDITTRQFTTIYRQLLGKISAIKEKNKRNSRIYQEKIKKLKKTIQRMVNKLEKVDPTKKKSLLFNIHQKKRKLAILETKLSNVLTDIKNNVIRLCFGSKKRFKQQFNLEENGYSSHEEWLNDWQQSRQSQFSLSGSKDETSGNQSCVITRQADGSYQLRVRLPNLNNCQDNYLILNDITFNYGAAHIEAAIDENLKRLTLQKAGDSNFKEFGTAIFYRFVKDDKGWRLFLSTNRQEPKIITNKNLGVIGVDLNANHLAVTETDRYGNPIANWTIPLPLCNKSSEQRKAIIGDAIKRVVAIAAKREKPIVKEKLDFNKKKAELQRGQASYARMLSSLSYNAIHCFILSRCFRLGVECFEVNPAYTSIIGKIKFAKRYGLSAHHAAALVIGRRLLNCSESPPRHQVSSKIEVPTGKADHVTFVLPVRNESKHVWSHWALISRQLKAVLAAHFKAIKDRSLITPGFGHGDCLSDDISF